MTRKGASQPGPCAVCVAVPVAARVDLDLSMADPARWPAAIFEVFEKPKGLPPSMREWGAIEVGQEWLREHGYADLTKPDVRLHYERHVPLIPADPAELVRAGVIAEGGEGQAPEPLTDPLAYLRFYRKGIEVGRKGLDLLMAHVADLEEKKEPVPMALVKLMLDVGAKLSTSQAVIRSRQKSQPEIDEEDEDDAFRGGGEPVPGQRLGHHRIRKVDGESRPVADEGPKDREHYRQRSLQEGGTGL